MSVSNVEIMPEVGGIYNVCCNSAGRLAGWHYTYWLIFTCDAYLDPTSWQALYASFEQYYGGENNKPLSDVVPFMTIKNTGTAYKIIEGDYMKTIKNGQMMSR